MTTTPMRPTEILKQEHRVIEQVLDCLDVLATRARSKQELDLRSTREVLEVLGTFADACHHMKEERALFTRMEQRGIPRHAGPLAVMLDEHVSGRECIRRMREALVCFEQGERAAALVFAVAAGQYTELLHDHIAKEDQVLFPMAEACFRDEDREAVLAAFAEAETKDLGAGTHERMLALVDGLMERLGVPKGARPARAAHGCGHGGGGCGHH